MAAGRRRLPGETNPKLAKLKYEVAKDLGLKSDIDERGWDNMTTREVGKIGGNMVKKMVDSFKNEND
ncbi:alpha/beta-type small acid-soluble spore protein [Natranaerobius trueperi]|uniref:Spore protein alpha/beta n=1 Tax=Natranaerobius trueperi TaxID=759412 RepID=A0A226BXE1_9FIRM|nr:alpha/beta-type small acid-soluble spore protein [Natranaerobius trueperi]OWZ83442.1 spore protein alpha/beta [Natranaerobius trueperi]